jgi:hypothetical protein
MTGLTADALAALDARYAELLQLTPTARELLARAELLPSIRERFANDGFVKVTDVLAAQPLVELVTDLLPILNTIAEPVTLRQEPTPDGRLSDGARFWRVDPHCAPHGDKLTRLLATLGLVEFGSLLSSSLTPLIREIAGPVSYQRTYVYLYKEGDYVSVHDDHHVGMRVDVQFPITLGSVGGVRVLSNGFLQMHYDTAGSMNVLGPGVWHDVPPLLRGESGGNPHRVNLGFRFTPEVMGRKHHADSAGSRPATA